jgi:hypothetical protein
MPVTLNLDLIKSLLTEVSVLANPKFDPSKEVADDAPLGFATSISHEVKSEGVHGISMTIEMSDEQAPYKFKVTGLVFLGVQNPPKDSSKEEIADSVTAYGVQVIYGSIREQLHSISLRGPWEKFPVVLEICDLAGMMRDHKAAQKSSLES